MRRGALAGLLALATCGQPASLPGLGLDLQLRVTDAQLMRGGLGPDEGGPEVTQILRPQPEVLRGESTVELGGRLGAGGVALHVHAAGDPDHWLVAPQGFDFVIPDELLWDAQLQFSHAIETDQLGVRLQAADEDGRLGPVEDTSFSILPDVPPAQLLVSLGWDAPVDLDLHVETPDGVVVGAKNTNSVEPIPGQVPPPDAWMEGGVFSFDSNQQCRLDLRNRENVVWATAPPPGRYRVFVHLFSPCGQASVNFTVTAQRGGRLIAEGRSTQYEFDSRTHPPDGEAPGLLTVEFEVE